MKLVEISQFIAARSKMLQYRYKDVLQFHVDAVEEKVTRCHNFDVDGGSFFETWDDEHKTSGVLVHCGSSLKVPIPSEFCGRIITFVNNHQDDLACLRGEYSDPSVFRVFQKANVSLPKPHFQKRTQDTRRTGDMVVPNPAANAPARAILTTEELAAHDESQRGSGHVGGHVSEGEGQRSLPLEGDGAPAPPRVPGA